MRQVTTEVVDARRLGVFYVENDIYALPLRQGRGPFTDALNHAAQCVYMNLCRRCNAARECRPLIGTIAADIGLSRATVVRALATLQAVGLLEVTNTGGANIYLVKPVTAFLSKTAPREPSENSQGVIVTRRKLPGSHPKTPREPSENSQGATEGLLLEGLLLEGQKETLPASPDSPNKRIKFNAQTQKLEGIEERDRERLLKTYPGVNLDQTIRELEDWLVRNPENYLKRGARLADRLSNFCRTAATRPAWNGNGSAPKRGYSNDAWKGRKVGDVTW